MANDNHFQGHASPPETAKQPYVAYGLVKLTKPLARVEIHRHDGGIFAVDNATLLDVVATGDEYCSLIYDRCTLEFSGYHLSSLADLLRCYEIRFAECFNPDIHRKPPDNYPLIDGIEWEPALKVENRTVRSKCYQTNVLLVRME